ncbi:MAG: protein rep [Bacteroidia bacterium]
MKLSNFDKNQFNKLGQQRTDNKTKPKNTSDKTLKGKGSKINPEKTGNWAKRKTISSVLLLNLITVAEKKSRNPKIIKSYRNAYYCLNEVETSGNKLFGKYCKNRHCLNCAAIRKAELINKYLPIVKQWKDPQLVTLTIKAIPAKNLKKFMKEGMVKAIKRIIARYRKRSYRNDSKPMIGIRALECNFNPQKRTYNPHYHLIVSDLETAKNLVKDWMALWTNKHTGIYSQNIRPVKDTTKDLIEVIKYGTKIFTDPTMKKGRNKKTPHFVYVSAIDNILNAMIGIRQFEHFGFKIPKQNKVKFDPEIAEELKQWQFDLRKADWTDIESDDNSLSGHSLDPNTQNTLENNINLDLE